MSLHCARCRAPLEILVVVEPDAATTASLARIERALGIITHDEEQTMTTVEQLAADFGTYKGDVGAAFARLQASLDAALANQGGIPAEVQAEIDATDAAIKGADADANAEDPAPAEVPAVDVPTADAPAEDVAPAE